jgi:hypothetical protein
MVTSGGRCGGGYAQSAETVKKIRDMAWRLDNSAGGDRIRSRGERVLRMNKSKIAGLVILIVVVLAGLNFAISRASPSVPASFNNLPGNLVRLYRGDLGFWLSGDLVKTPVTDWSFTDAIPTIQIETRTWYLLPHVLRTYIARDDNQLYLFSEYFAPKQGQRDYRDDFPNARFWNRMVVRDPHIQVKIGDRLFQMRAYPLLDPAQVAAARQAFLEKYPDVRKEQASPESRRSKLYFFRLEPGWNGNS